MQDLKKCFQISDDGRPLASSQTIVDLFGIGRQTLSGWKARGLDQERTGWWDLRKVIIFKLQGAPVAAKAESQARLQAAKADLAELDLKQRNGELVAYDVVEAKLGDLFANIKTSLLSLGDRIQAATFSQYPELSALVRRMVDTEVREALKKLSENGRFKPERKKRRAVGRPKKGR